MFHLCSKYALVSVLISFVASQTVAPFPAHQCSSSVYTGDTACNNNLNTCCAATGQCCAGGCCPENAYCVFVGTANEACCSLSDSTQCGEAPPQQSSKTCPNPSAPSVPCSGVDDSWYCAPGCTCNDSIYRGCNCFTGCSNGGDENSSSAAPTSSADVTPASAAATTQAQSSVVGPASGGGSSTTAAAAAAAATTTTNKANKARELRVQAAWALIFGITALGIVIIL